VNIEEMQVETSRRDKRFEKCAEKKIRCKVCSGLIYAKMSGNYQWKCWKVFFKDLQSQK